MPKYNITIAKEYLKFSAAHFTIFNDHSLEKLHGHNYRLSLRMECRETIDGIAVEFKRLKKILQQLCEELDEKVLFPTESPYLKISKIEDHFEIVFAGEGFSKSYRLPCEDVELLPVSNITAELLARHLSGAFRKKLEAGWDKAIFGEVEKTVIGFELTVEETDGQSVGFSWEY